MSINHEDIELKENTTKKLLINIDKIISKPKKEKPKKETIIFPQIIHKKQNSSNKLFSKEEYLKTHTYKIDLSGIKTENIKNEIIDTSASSSPIFNNKKYDIIQNILVELPNTSSHPIESNIQLGYDKKKRVISGSKQWNKEVENKDITDFNTQLSYLNNECNLLKQQIMIKINGYKYQDQLKGLYNEDNFVTYPYVYNLLKSCKLKCFYCHLECMVIYEFVREPKQWTLERIDNNFGHNHGNVQIACLECNLRRRTIHHERYIMTKQLMNIRKIFDDDEYENHYK